MGGSRYMLAVSCGLFVSWLACLSTHSLTAQVIAPSFYTTAITVTGEEPGTEFDDWAASGIPVAVTDPMDNAGAIDIHEIQVANDNQFIYIRASYYSDLSNGAYLAFDLDRDPFTGFDLFGLALIGSELGYVNDFPFEQGSGVWNTNDALTGGPIGNGGSLLFPAWDQQGPQREWAVPLDVAFTNPDQPAFAGDTFNFWVWTDSGDTDIPDAGAITYTLASAPAVNGDFNNDDSWDCLDVNALTAAIAGDSTDLSFDMTGDGVIDIDDLTDPDAGWLTVGGSNNPLATGGDPFLEGDANLDGSVDVSDFNEWNANKFTSAAAWCAGDFNADGSVDVSDFNTWNGKKFTSSGGPDVVPEPGLATLLGAAGFFAAAFWRRRFQPLVGVTSCP